MYNSKNSLVTNIDQFVIGFRDYSSSLYISLFLLSIILLITGLVQMFYFKSKVSSKRFFTYSSVPVIIILVMWGLIAFLTSLVDGSYEGDIPTPGRPESVRTY